MDHSKKSTYLFSIDALRVVAILAVILIHITTKTLATLHLDITVAPFSLFINQTARFAVPLFFLISGFVLELNNKEGLSYRTFFKKRASRIIVPYLFWTSLYYIVNSGFVLQKLFTQKYLLSVILGNASYHLYFIPTLILFYLAFPFLHSVIRFLKHPLFFLVIWGIEFFLLYHDYYVKQWNFSYDIRIAILSISMFITGMVASHYKDRLIAFVRKYVYIFICILLLFPFFIFSHVQSITLKAHSSRYIYNQYNPLNYLYALTFFSLLFYALEKSQFGKRAFIELSKLSFFVFFIHVLIQSLLWDWIVEGILQRDGDRLLKSFLFDPFMFCAIAGVSFGLAFFVHKIPYANKLTG